MKTPILTLLTLLTALLLAPLAALQADEAPSPKPNIIFLLADDQTAGAVGYYGNKDVITPNIDKLAQDGVRFANHYDTTSICMASRCSVMTGLYEYRHGCNFEHGDLERRFIEQSYPVLLRQAGYFTGFAGKIGFVLAGREVRGVWSRCLTSMGRRSGADALRDGEERGHREVCGAVSALLAGLRRVGAGFPEGGEAERQAVLHERSASRRRTCHSRRTRST